MEGQGKRLILAVALALGIVLLWNVLFPPDKPKPKPPAAEVEAEKPRWDSPAGQPTPAAESGVDNVATPTTTAEDKTIVLSGPQVTATFSRKGARLVSWKLSDPKWARDWNKGEFVAEPGRGEFGINFIDSTVVLDPDAIWESEEPEPNVVRFVYRSAALEVIKTFRMHPDAYMLELSVELRNLGDAELKQRMAVV